MSVKNKIQKMVSLDNYLMSTNGYPIFDIMHPVKRDNGHGQKLDYWGASGTVFYTEDENTIAKLKEIKEVRNSTVEDIKKFLLANIDKVIDLQALQQKGVKLMNEKEVLAFRHLSTAENRKYIFKNGSYGVAHIVENDRILIFYQGHPVLSKMYEGKDLNNLKNYAEAQAYLIKQYKEGKVQPDGEFTGEAKDKVMNSLLDINFVSLSKFQKDTLMMLQEFKNTILPDVKFYTSIVQGNHMAYFTQGTNTIEVCIPEDNKSDFLIRHSGKYNKVAKVSDVLGFVSKEIAEDQVANFLRRKKM